MAVKSLLLSLTFTLFISSATSARDLPVELPTGFNLAERLEDASGSLFDCMMALTEIKSCSNEIVIYFSNGTTDISPPCCTALKMVTHHCWPAMLTALGFTPDQCNILRGYCDATVALGPTMSLSVEPSQSTLMNEEA